MTPPLTAPNPGPARLRASGLRFAYPGGDFALALDSLAVLPRQTLLLSGPSGSGKSTLLRLLCGLLPLQSGSLTADESLPLHSLSPSAIRAWRLRHAGLIFQDFALLDYLTARENILLPSRFLHLPDSGRRALINSLPPLAARLDLDSLLDRPVCRLSQGERQRVAILRSLVASPSLILADEPTASLDRKRRDQVITLLQDHVQSSGAALILVTHDPDLAAAIPFQIHLPDLQPA